MDINTMFQEEVKRSVLERFKKYENKVYLNNKDIVRELNITSTDNLRKQLSMGMYQGLYEEKQSSKESYRWNKFKFFKWYLEEQLKAIGDVC